MVTRTLRDVLGHLVAGLLLLLALAATPWAALGLPLRFPVAALAVYVGAIPFILAALPARLPGERFGAGNGVTLARLAVTAVLAAALALPTDSLADPALGWVLFALAAGAFLLDGVDGWVARRAGAASAFGARFDMELDAFVTLVLAALAWLTDKAGAWVMAAGLARYAFIAAAACWPMLREPLPPSRRRRVICGVAVGTLSAVMAPAVAPPLSTLAAALATAAVAGSFASDALWLVRRQPGRTGPARN